MNKVVSNPVYLPSAFFMISRCFCSHSIVSVSENTLAALYIGDTALKYICSLSKNGFSFLRASIFLVLKHSTQKIRLNNTNAMNDNNGISPVLIRWLIQE